MPIRFLGACHAEPLKIRLTKSAHDPYQADRIPLRIGWLQESRLKALAHAGALCVRGESGSPAPSIGGCPAGAGLAHNEAVRPHSSLGYRPPARSDLAAKRLVCPTLRFGQPNRWLNMAGF